MKNIFLILMATFFIFSCSKDDKKEPNNNGQNPERKLVLEVIDLNKFGFFDLDNNKIFETSFELESTTELYLFENASDPYSDKRIQIGKINNPQQDASVVFQYFDGQNQREISGVIEKIGSNFVQIKSEGNRLVLPLSK